jgi:hypothetical protein
MEAMTTVAFDTLASAKRLEEKGLPRQHAEALAQELAQARQVDLSNLATKQDVFAVKQDVLAVKQELKQDLEILRRDLTIKFGTMLAAAVALLFGLLKAFPPG